MLHAQQIEELIHLVSAMDRQALVRHFATYRATFPLDFSSEFLNSQTLERLRHIFLALCLYCQRLPEPTLAATAA